MVDRCVEGERRRWMRMARRCGSPSAAAAARRPNPMVGAVVVDAEGVVVGVGRITSARVGRTPRSHALSAAGPRARGRHALLHARAVLPHGTHRPLLRGASPRPASGAWSWRSGIRIRRWRAAGSRYLRRARHRGGRRACGERRPRGQNAPFFTRDANAAARGSSLKIATSLDGARRRARRASARRSVGPRPSRCAQRLRAEVDAIAVGAGTVLVDDPVLTARDVYRAPSARPRRVRLRGCARRPRRAWSVDARAGPVVVVDRRRRSRESPARRRAAAIAASRCWPPTARVPGGARARWLRARCTSLLLEGGPTLHAAALEGRRRRPGRQLVSDRVLGPEAVPLGRAARSGCRGWTPRTRAPRARRPVWKRDVHRTH